GVEHCRGGVVVRRGAKARGLWSNTPMDSRPGSLGPGGKTCVLAQNGAGPFLAAETQVSQATATEVRSIGPLVANDRGRGRLTRASGPARSRGDRPCKGWLREMTRAVEQM